MTQGLALLVSDCAESGIQSISVPQPGDVEIESYHGGDPGRCGQALTGQRAGIGIMVFSSSCKTLYANQAAYGLIKVLNRWERGHATDGVLPDAIAGLYDQMELALASRMMNGDGKRLEARRLLMGEGRTVRLHAVGLPDRRGMEGSRVVITIEGGIDSDENESRETIAGTV
jgi:hypothetical protein